MAGPLTDDERDDIAARLQAGESYVAIAKATGRGKATIARVAQAIGYSSAERSALARTRAASEARSAFSAERRAQIAARLTVEAEKLLDGLHGEFLVFNFGGKDNDYNEHLLEEPPVEAKRAMIQSAREAMRTVLDIDRHDNRADDGASAVDEWLRSIVGEAAG